MKRKSLFAAVLLSLLAACIPVQNALTDYVNPFIGTGGHGHTYPGAVVPHGLVQLSPDTRLADWDACSGYYYDDSSLLGFSHTHLSGTGIGDYGDFLFLPYTGSEPKKIAPNGQDRYENYGSRFSHDEEQASTGYYKVRLADYDVTAELTTTLHTGFHRYTFPNTDDASLLIDLNSSVSYRRVQDASFTLHGDTAVSGTRHVRGWAQNRYAYFYAVFSKPFTFREDAMHRGFFSFGSMKQGEQLNVKVGISFVDEKGASNNLYSELSGRDFEAVRESARSAWENELSKVQVQGSDNENKTIFYTALYHTLLEPTINSDVDGRYRTMDNRIARDKDYTNYTVMSLWDTFRALNPLYTVVWPQTEEAIIRSLIHKYEEGGILPMWELASNYTGCMIGSHAISLIVDAYMKGMRNFDVEKAYEACKFSTIWDTVHVSPTIPRWTLKNDLMSIGKEYKNTIGYIPADKVNQSVSKGLEYAYNDWMVARFAESLGKTADALRYDSLGQAYKRYYDPSTGFMRGKLADGSLRTPFDPTGSDHFNADYVEGNAWQWTWFVPHDVQGLATLMGGREAFLNKLDSLFSVSSVITGDNASPDISGLIGQYAHGNEPSHHIIYMYSEMGQPWKTQAMADSIMHSLYFNDPNGLSGNEDCGQMSAWYVFNAVGFYPYCPGKPEYAVARPLFDEAVINLDNGKTFTVRALNNSRENKYVQSMTLNGRPLNRPFLTHQQIMDGGVLELQMTNNYN
jgi:predicted alpha-1,2-mannosidase